MSKRIKRDYDDKMGMLEDVAISVNVFIKRMLGVYDDNIMRAEITHKDLVKMFPKLKRTSYDAIMDDPSCIYSGDVIVVRDSTMSIIPYINYKKNNYLETEEFEEILVSGSWVKDETTGEWIRKTVEDNDTWVKEDNSVEHAVKYDLKKMSNYELETLMSLYTKTGQWHDYEVVRRELIKRDDCSHANKKSKRKALERAKKNDKDEYDY